MCASFKLLSGGTPAPRVVLLPDAVFFSRAVAVTTDAVDAKARASDVSAQVELAFETLAPFPLGQLYYGHFWAEGSTRALAFAAYRRRFTAEQTAEWASVELVLPTFVALAHAQVAPATTVVLATPEGLTAVHWADGPVPDRVIFKPLAPETPDEERASLREALLRNFESKAVIDVTTPPVAEFGDSEGEFIFRAGELVSKFTSLETPGLDVRDKDELGALRRARRRDILMWRSAVACVIAFAVLLVGEIALGGGRLWEGARKTQVNAQAPGVARIESEQQVANHISDLRTKRLLTIEMLLAVASKKSDAIFFTSVSSSATNLYTLVANGQTANPAEISVFQDALQKLPEVVSGGVSLRGTGTRTTPQGLVSTFTLQVTFKPDSLKPATS